MADEAKVKVENDSTRDTVKIPATSLINPEKLEKFKKLERAKEEFAKGRKVVLNNIPDGVDLEDLKTTIMQGLNAIEVKIGKKSVVISFKNAPDAEKGVTTLKSLNSDFQDRGITVIIPQPDSLLFVGNLPLEFTDEEFEKLMSQYGTLERVFLVRSEATGESKGYGFAEFLDKKTAGEAKQQLLNSGAKYISGRILRVDFAEPNLNSYSELHSKTLFIDKLPRDFTDGEMLRELFSRTGTVTFAQVGISPQTGSSRGFAFVDYATGDEAEKGQAAHNGATIGSCNIRTAFATPGRLGASIVGNNLSNMLRSKPVSLMSAISPNALIRPPPPPPMLQMNMHSPRPLMASQPLMGFHPWSPMGMMRGPDPRFPMSMMRHIGPLEFGDPRAAFFQRPRGPRPGMLQMNGPRPPAPMGVSSPRGPLPLMTNVPMRQPYPRPMVPRAFTPKGISAPPPGPISGPAGSLMTASNKGVVQQSEEMKGTSGQINPQMRPQIDQMSSNKDGSALTQPSQQSLMSSQNLQSNTSQGSQRSLLQSKSLLAETRALVNQYMGSAGQSLLGPSPGVHQAQSHTGQTHGVLHGQSSLHQPVGTAAYGNGASTGTSTPSPLMSVTTKSSTQVGLLGSSFPNNSQQYGLTGGQSYSGQNTTSGQPTGYIYNQTQIQNLSQQTSAAAATTTTSNSWQQQSSMQSLYSLAQQQGSQLGVTQSAQKRPIDYTSNSYQTQSASDLYDLFYDANKRPRF